MRLLGAELCFVAALGGIKLSMMDAVALSLSSTSVSSTARNTNGSNHHRDLSNVVVRTGRLDEAQQLSAVINDAFQASAYFKKEGCADRVTPDGKQVEDIMKQPCCAFLVAEESCSTHDIRDTTKSGSRIVGCVEIDWSGRANCGGKRPGVDAIFGMLSVKSEHLRRGIGQLLVASAERRCRQELAREYCMEISVERSDLLKWYQDQGYVMGGQVSFPVPEIIRDEFDVKLQLLTKILP